MRLFTTVIPAVTLGINPRNGQELTINLFDGQHLCDTMSDNDGNVVTTFTNFCHDTVNGICTCPPSSMLNMNVATNPRCDFVNGCNPDANDQCHEHATCANLNINAMIGTNNACMPDSTPPYTCTCNLGYSGDGFLTGDGCGDKDECQDSPCSGVAGAICVNKDITAASPETDQYGGRYECNCIGGEDVFYTTSRNADADNSLAACNDYNYCQTLPCGTADNVICTDTVGHPAGDTTMLTIDDAFTCSCPSGWNINTPGDGAGNMFWDQTTCVDVDECTDGPNDCVDNEQTTCTNKTPTEVAQGYICECVGAGGVMNAEGTECIPETECPALGCEQGGTTDLHATCNENGFDPYSCDCLPGWQENGAGVCDLDINECDLPDVCSATPNSHCVNAVGDFACVCDDGFFWNSGTQTCDDYDECANPADHSCVVNSHCVNCVRTDANCDDGYTCECDTVSVGGVDTAVLEFDNSGACVDIDECGAATSPCGAGLTCVNTNCLSTDCADVGGYECTCSQGMEKQLGFLDGALVESCVDVNECATFEDNNCNIHEGQKCFNLEVVNLVTDCDDGEKNDAGNCMYNCACGNGMSWDSVNDRCVDIDECDIDDICGDSPAALCTNIDRSLVEHHTDVVVNGVTVTAAFGVDGNGYTCSCDNCGVGNPLFTWNDDILDCDYAPPCDSANSNACDQLTTTCTSTFSGTSCPTNNRGYTCECQDGFEAIVDEDNMCTDILECTINSAVCGQSDMAVEANNVDMGQAAIDGGVPLDCVEAQGTYGCACPAGFTAMDICDNVSCSCEAVDDCANDPCGENASCTDLSNMSGANPVAGTHQCNCNEGYAKNADGSDAADVGDADCIDIDEAAHSLCSNCPANTECENTVGSYICHCLNGWQMNSDNTACIDFNECAAEADNNSTGQRSFIGILANCELSTTTCVPGLPGAGSACVCNAGLEFAIDDQGDTSETHCVDANECTDGSHNCDALANCGNIYQSFTCTCQEGYAGTGVVGDCADIDECAEADACGANEDCTNNVGSFTCACKDGYAGDPCIDINECDNVNHCQAYDNTECSNFDGGAECVCKGGYQNGGQVDVACTNIEHCVDATTSLDGACHDNSSCRDLVGHESGIDHTGVTQAAIGYTCECNAPGWTYDQVNTACANVNECASNPCTGATCEDTDGSYICHCIDGYEKVDEVNSPDMCTNINECANSDLYNKCQHITLNTNTPLIQSCKNNDPGYECECVPGTKLSCVGDLCTCDDVDECASANPPSCQANSHCVNDDYTIAASTHHCECDAGYLMNGSVCEDIDECNGNADECPDANTVCTNLPGTYDCSCVGGYKKTEATKDATDFSVACENVNECDEGGNDCFSTATGNNQNEICSDLTPGWSCDCPTHTTLTADGCVDDNECTTLCIPDDTKDCTDKLFHTTGDTHSCECKSGYEKDLDNDSTGNTCINIDECSLNTKPCTGIDPQCDDETGSYTCSCPTAGTRLVGDDCVNIDECNDDVVVYPCDQTCVDKTPAEGKYECGCNDGWSLNADNHMCDDIDECDDTVPGYVSPCDINASCANDQGTFTCTCNIGWTGDDSVTALVDGPCIDFDECANNAHNCQDPNGECSNTQGSFECVCQWGYRLGDHDDDINTPEVCVNIDECAEGNNNCRPSATCTDQDINQSDNGQPFVCSCNEDEGQEQFNGFDSNGPYVTCSDVDECEDSSHRCHTHASCDNHEWNGTSGYTCTCNAGYEPWTADMGEFDDGSHEHADARDFGPVCVNIDECTIGTHDCDPNARCTDTDGSFECKCKRGYTGSPPGYNCIDYDECANGLQAISARRLRNGDPHNLCPANSDCANLSLLGGDATGYNCQCRPGYEIDETDEAGIVTKCKNIDECATDADDCHEKAECADNNGSFDCTCMTGWQGDGKNCIDVLECSTDQDNCDDNASCTNTPGSFTCACNTGYTGDGVEGTCENINECSIGTDNCHANADCEDTEGSYLCHCWEGYTGDGRACADINECLFGGNNDCDTNAVCTNNGGGFDCTCADGWTGSGQSCEPVDYCTDEANNQCANDGRAECTNVPKTVTRTCDANDTVCTWSSSGEGYSCACTDGWTGTGKVCDNINECTNNTHDCHAQATCADNEGSWACACNGPFWQGNGQECTDVNECLDVTACSSIHEGVGIPECQNHDLGYSCICPDGFEHQASDKVCGDIDECASDPCDALATCANNVGGHTCTCPAGYYTTDAGKNCLNINECVANEHANHNCVNADCADEDGSFTCTCHTGFEDEPNCVNINECAEGGSNNCHVDATCLDTTGSFDCECKSGYEGSGVECTDVDECATGKHNCGDNTICTNNVGSWDCECETGFEGVPTDGCTDINECNKTNQCSSDANCANTFGSYTCTCKDGYAGNGMACDNVNECEGTNDCGAHSTCTDKVPSVDNVNFSCSCDTGYEAIVADDERECTNIDECNVGSDDCDVNATCADTDGSFTCTCIGGYEGTGQTCTDINECDVGTHVCGTGSACTNEAGGYSCGCETGYIKDLVTQGTTVVAINCLDIDECAGKNDCHENAECENNQGGYECACRVGYFGDGYYGQGKNGCTDVNECNDNPCDANADCFNTDGSYTCTCCTGWSGDGKECHDVDECNQQANSNRRRRDSTALPIPDSNCHENGFCTNRDGSFDCACSDGYEGDGFECTNLNECDLETHDCNTHATCADTDGSFTCTCNEGWSGNGVGCININECDAVPCSENAECEDTAGSFTCTCLDGYDGDGFECVDINECAKDDDNNCHAQASCHNTPGDYYCTCNDGYDGSGVSCSNINECGSSDNCSDDATCKDTIGSFMCTCNAGYAGDGVTCEDVNECDDSPCSDNGSCENTIGAFSCTCNAGYDGDGFSCVDVDECEAEPCDENAKCANTAGSFICTCNAGWTSDDGGFTCTNIDECDKQTDDCHDELATCSDTPGSYQCACVIGYIGNGVTCNDKDECADKPCHADAVCANSVGSFSCTCNAGYTGDGFECTDNDECASEDTNDCHADATCSNIPGSYTCACKDGYTGDGKSCVDDNECNDGSHNCHADAACSNNPGSFSCACNGGYSGDGVSCTDNDECANSDDNDCHDDASCSNFPGSYTCKCDTGYSGDGFDCADIDECSGNNECADHASCENTIGSYECTCNAGYEGTGRVCENIDECAAGTHTCVGERVECDDKTPGFNCRCPDGFEIDAIFGTSPQEYRCLDFNECDEGKDHCDVHATCSNTMGSYDCTCNDGFAGNGWLCVDVNECLGHPCDTNAICSNTVGTYECDCFYGWTGDGWSCTDVDECLANMDPEDNCDDNAACSNTEGSFTCACNKGYTGTGVAGDCVNVDECADGSNMCHADASCTDTTGSYTCACNDGYSGDGFTCSDIDECSQNTDDCHDNAECSNKKGSYTCKCKDGYSGNGFACENVNECDDSLLNNCSSHARCDDTDGSFTCTCNNGYTAGANNGVECLDNDECAADNTNNCSTDANCTNKPGTYECECHVGYTGDGVTCTDVDECADSPCSVDGSCENTVGSFSCSCDSGFTGDGFNCANDDECADKTHNCHADATCTDNHGSFDCDCDSGYTGDGVTCDNIDECANETDSCDDNATCSDNKGSYTCACNTGFTGTGEVCADVDECATPSSCDEHAACENSVGSFFCTCQAGWKNNGVEGSSATPGHCDNINECFAENECHENAACSDTQGSYECDCVPGYRGDGRSCKNIDECAEEDHDCDMNATCGDTDGDYTCTCNDGWQGDGFSCTDILECDLEDTCAANTDCTELPGNYDCTCATGYKGDDAFNVDCVDIDECAEGNECDENASCSNTVGSYTCSCNTGYSGNGRVCIDDNECEMGTHRCTGTAVQCNNLPGTYECNCPDGYFEDSNILPGNIIEVSCTDMDECLFGADRCDRDHGSCQNTEGGFECKCATGYHHQQQSRMLINIGSGINNGLTCVDTNECEMGTHSCSADATCSNTDGSYSCSCNDGFTGDGHSCMDFNECMRGRSALVGPDAPFCHDDAFCTNTHGGYECACKVGYAGDGFACADVNECDGSNECSMNAACSNTIGSYTCACNNGWEGNGNVCTDINECAASPCDSNGSCSNNPGSFECSCNTGYTGTGFVCADIDECATEGACGANTNCANSDGSYSCSCMNGFEGDAMAGCTDIDECAASPCSDDGSCANNVGSFECACNDGYSGNGFECTDNNECADPTNIPEHSTCENVPGSFIIHCNTGFFKADGLCHNVVECEDENICVANSDCVDTIGSYRCDCHNGFIKAADGSCADIDECFEGSHTCDANASCSNRVGSYDCTCNTGYTGTGESCTDIDECKVMMGATMGSVNPCSANGECANNDGSYTCTCSTGYSGDGFTCSDVNECNDANTCTDVAQSTCVNSVGSFNCACNNGWHKNNDGQCDNINECDAFECSSNSLCQDTLGSFECVCDSGYRNSAESTVDVVCEDINECTEQTAECPANGFCVNEAGSYSCKCNEGYEGEDCVDIKECSAPVSPCHANAACIEMEGSFECKCNNGYTGTGFSCADINECATQGAAACGANAGCTNTDGAHTCACNDGFEGDAMPGVGCTDINECETVECMANSWCDNTFGSFECICDSGYVMENGECVDINECDTFDCGANTNCVNQPGSFTCVCEEGYSGSNANGGLVCTDIDECAAGTNNCDDNATCHNTPGTFMCKCNTGYSGDGVSCLDNDECALNPCDAAATCTNTAGSFECACNSGYSGSGFECTDIDECQAAVAKLADGDKCDVNAACINTIGGFNCLCNDGYDGNGFVCTDIDECATGAHNCDINAACTNSEASFSCACFNGFTGDGNSCTDDCDIDTTCDENFTCSHIEDGTAVCDCINGFQLDEDGACVDIDECESGTDTCDENADCANGHGGYLCTCHTGYEGSGHVCANIDECAIEGSCPANSICADIVPGHICRPEPGYEMMLIGNQPVFIDIDECARGTDNCHDMSNCNNLEGSFECTCDDDTYDMDQDGACVRDECTLGLDNCGANTDCTDTKSGFTCKCMSGFFGHKDGAEGDDCAPNSEVENMPGLALDMLNAFTNHFVRSDKSKRITKIGAKTASTLKSALGKANGKAKGKQCLREVAAARIAEISAMFEQQATDLAAGNITNEDEAANMVGDAYQLVIDTFFTSKSVCTKYNVYNKNVNKVKKEMKKACDKNFCFDYKP